MTPELAAALDRAATLAIRHGEAEAALAESARRLASAGRDSEASRRAYARCEVLERRARLHLRLAREELAAVRRRHFDDIRRVPASFRRRRPAPQPTLEILGRDPEVVDLRRRVPTR